MKTRTVNNLPTIIAFLIVVALLGLFSIPSHLNKETYTITVTDKEVKRSGDDDKYIVFGETKDGEAIVFQNTDMLTRFKFNSSDIQAKLKVGNTYEVTTIGFRINLLSKYPNIIDMELVEEE